MAKQIVIVDYGAGNLRSVARAVAHNGYEALVSCEAKAIETADALILPGVGAAADTMRNLSEGGLIEPIRKYIGEGRPFLGVCMGQQALLTVSEEGGEHPCLDVIPGRVKRLPAGLKVPHMGWNELNIAAPGHAVFKEIPTGGHAYFVHSYHMQCRNPGHVLATVDYGQTVTAAVGHDNMVGTQFHPEKSQELGLKFISNFLAWKP